MKICFLNQNLNIYAGVGRYGRDIINNISQVKDMEIIVLTEEKSDDNFNFSILSPSFRLRQLPYIFINALRIRKYIKKCDIIHALDGYPYGVIATLANIGLNKKLIINGIGTYSVLPLDKPIKCSLLRWAYKKANKVLCISKFTEKQILNRVKLNNTIIINHGVDYDKFQVNYQKQNTEKIVLSVGALKMRKGYHVSIPAIAEVKKKYPEIKYYIVGGKPTEMYLNLVEKYNLKENVRFFYNISDEELIKLYYDADIFLLTPVTINDNDFEGFGLVYLEAGACGRPVIGTYDCGAEEAIINNTTGILISQNDVRATTEAVLKLLNNPDLAEKMGQNGKEFAKKMSWSNMTKEYIKIYDNN